MLGLLQFFISITRFKKGNDIPRISVPVEMEEAEVRGSEVQH